MPSNTMPNTAAAADIEDQRAHVVYRSFPSETVVLNLQTGKYHGLNATAGSMLEALQQASCIRDAVAAVAEDYAKPRATASRICANSAMFYSRGGWLSSMTSPPAKQR